jgi:hypothetical protein
MCDEQRTNSLLKVYYTVALDVCRLPRNSFLMAPWRGLGSDRARDEEWSLVL